MIDAVTAEAPNPTLSPEKIYPLPLRLRPKLRPPLLSRFADLRPRRRRQHPFLYGPSSLPVESPRAFAAARIPVSLCCGLPNCFSSFSLLA